MKSKFFKLLVIKTFLTAVTAFGQTGNQVGVPINANITVHNHTSINQGGVLPLQAFPADSPWYVHNQSTPQSPTARFNVSSATVTGQLTAGVLRTGTGNIKLTTDAGLVYASKIASGTLNADVIASSIAVAAVYPGALLPCSEGEILKVTGGKFACAAAGGGGETNTFTSSKTFTGATVGAFGLPEGVLIKTAAGNDNSAINLVLDSTAATHGIAWSDGAGGLSDYLFSHRETIFGGELNGLSVGGPSGNTGVFLSADGIADVAGGPLVMFRSTGACVGSHIFFSTSTGGTNYIGATIEYNPCEPLGALLTIAAGEGGGTNLLSMAMDRRTIRLGGTFTIQGGNVGSPTVSSCGAGASMGGSDNDNVGHINTGAGGPISCTLTFARTWDSPPICVASGAAGGMGVSSVSTTAVTFNGAMGSDIYYHCIGGGS